MRKVKAEKPKRKKTRANPFLKFDKNYRIPAQISKISPEQVRNFHSYWGSQYVYAQSVMAEYEARLKLLQGQRRVVYNRAFNAYKLRRSYANELAKTRAESDKVVVNLDESIYTVEMELITWRSLTESCRTFMSICSREQSYREKEREYFYNKGGRGK